MADGLNAGDRVSSVGAALGSDRFDVWCELGSGRRWLHNDLEGPLSWEQAVLTVRWIEAALARDEALLPVVVNVRLAGGW